MDYQHNSLLSGLRAQVAGDLSVIDLQYVQASKLVD